MRYALGVEYDGSAFQGWQQLGESGGPSVQATLQGALSSVADVPVSVVCAGRTDAGVHGECQVVHFDCAALRPPRGWMLGATARLPPSVCVRWCVPVADDFHARFSARARRYRYRLLNRQVRPALYRQTLSWERRPLQVEAMHIAAQALLGEQDFSAFRSVQCQALHARRELQSIVVTRNGELVEFQLQANAFLHHMVRNIVGSLVMVGTGEKPVSWIGELLSGRNRRIAGPTASPQGLVFVGPLYPAHWTLPDEVTL
ncbi:tRNA pseudouridine(38-40) synthase TruA [Xanthomonas albilineans]|uniref:tRNA pseudouridine synthase A n=1 Tax=Xanthomonas albilineans (strain GPE PC73 / CFBP 7063) TaxID=380358 RepID=D2UCB6_XANAP|nr:tRNA pseudouridine(38-40) synthase TruA [Xanthomonas albilineans]PPU92658.1 tRNA pseudouridine(38-40) synthase TruA [Xanthomonas albilineans]CBA15500.1 probable trna pseudouridine synthase a (trna-uridine isomeraseI (trna pseudouridylate synthaseI protein [Xanthomonas albilineans GPE PC73]